MANLDKTYLTLDQVAVKYSMSIDTLRRWARDGVIPCFRIGRKYLVEIDEMERFIETLKAQRKGAANGQA